MVNIKPTDQRLQWVPPQSDTDARVPTAQELDADSALHLQNLQLTQAQNLPPGLKERVSFGAAPNRGVVIPANLPVVVPGHPRLKFPDQPVTINLPALPDTTSTISRYDYIYLVVTSVEVTAVSDGSIRFEFRWRQADGSIQTVTKENTRRIRTAWFLLSTQGATVTAADVLAALSGTGVPQFTVSSAPTGVALGDYRLYTLDPTLTVGATYKCVPSSLQVVPLLRVWRAQNHNPTGWVWGRNGEATQFDPLYHFHPTYVYVGIDWQDFDNRAKATLRRILLGLPLPNSHAYNRVVMNLVNGQVGTNPDAPGNPANSPNGSMALANGQRISFTNQYWVETRYCLPVVTTNVNGAAQAVVPFQVSAPLDACFSEDPSDHAVYAADGTDVSGQGTWAGLGGTGSLIWIANADSTVSPGQTVYVVPAIEYPAGSGLPTTWNEVEAVYLNATPIHQDNVREAPQDLTAYTEPANGEQYIVVVGKERAALHDIYRKLTLTADASGVVRIPSTARGLIAFLSGPNAPTGRINKAVVTGLSANNTYQALVYHPPHATEQWQIQVRASGYAGTKELNFINNAKCVSDVICLAHTQGGGTSVFASTLDFCYEAVGFRLPDNPLSPVQHYVLDSKIRFLNDSYTGEEALRFIGDNEPIFPTQLTASSLGSNFERSMRCQISFNNNAVISFSKKPLYNGLPYQLVIAVVVVKNSDCRLLVATANTGNTFVTSRIYLTTNAPNYAAIDTFYLY